jgi:hypothetical protein
MRAPTLISSSTYTTTCEMLSSTAYALIDRVVSRAASPTSRAGSPTAPDAFVREVKDVGHVYQVQIKVLLKPNDTTIGAV